MYYGPYAFSRNGLKTTEPKVNQLLYLFLLSTFAFSERACGSVLKPNDYQKIISIL